jgi:hypothetical protein
MIASTLQQLRTATMTLSALAALIAPVGSASAQESVEEQEYWDDSEKSSGESSSGGSESSSGSNYSASPSRSGGSSSTRLGLGLNTTLTPSFFVPTSVTGFNSANIVSGVLTAFSIRIWMNRFMIEPLFGLALFAGNGVRTTFGFSTGALVGYALGTGNLRPIVGGGFRFGFITDDNVAFTFGPFVGLEYRFSELPNFSLEAAWMFPFNFVFDPFRFSMGTAGSIMAGVHWYFD